MPPEGEERERGEGSGRFDDLFDDLDRYFDEGDEESAHTAPPAEEGTEGAVLYETTPDDEPTPVAPVDEDILPEGWDPAVGGLDLGQSGEHPAIETFESATPDAEEQAAEAKEEPPETAQPAPAAGEPSAPSGEPSTPGREEPVSPGAEEPPAHAFDEPAGSAFDQPAGPAFEEPGDRDEQPGVTSEMPWKDESTAEMSSADWSRLRDVLGEEDQEEEFSFLTQGGEPQGEEGLFGGFRPAEDAATAGLAMPPGVSLPGEAEEPEEERRELTIEDLKKAPDVYRDLPGAQGGATAEESPSPPGEPATAGATEAGEPWAAEGDQGLWRHPDIAEVEHAADRLAQEFGPPVTPAGEPAGTAAARAGAPPAEQTGPAPSDEDLLADLQPPGPRTVKVGEPEALLGPTWEEPSSRPLTNEPAPPAGAFGGRDLPLAVLTAAGLVVVCLVTLALRKWLFAVVAGGVVLFGQAELYATMHRRGHQPATALGLVLGGLTLAGAYFKGEAGMLLMLPIGVLLSFLWYLAAPPKGREGLLSNIGSTMFGVLYLPFLAGYVLLMLTLLPSGRALMLAILGLTFLYDVAAFAVGSYFGSRALAPTISPRKSWEGLLGATIITFIVSIAFLPSIDPLTLARAVGIAIVVAVFAPLGDLAESALKRDLGVKDMGSILPGHGGILDRIDSVLLVAPAAWYLFRLIFS